MRTRIRKSWFWDTCTEQCNKNENKAVAGQGQRSCKVQATKQVTKEELFQIAKV